MFEGVWKIQLTLVMTVSIYKEPTKCQDLLSVLPYLVLESTQPGKFFYFIAILQRKKVMFALT
jgi:hypothetical protein